MKKSSVSQKIIPDYQISLDQDETDDLELPEIPTLPDFFPNEMLINRDCEAGAFQLCELEDLTQVIRHYSQSAAKNAEQALANAGLAVLDAWTCGSALNAAKKRCKHGNFKIWFHEEFSKSKSVDSQFSLRTAQRYMLLAKSFPTAEELIGSSPSLRQAYQACGILPAPPEPEKNSAEKDRVAIAQANLLKGVVYVRDRMRRFSDKKITLDEATRKELLNTKSEIDRLFASLVE